jgi:hypothetical protein
VASSPWLLRVVPDEDDPRWLVVQPRTSRTLGEAPTQELAVEDALRRLATGGTVEVVVDGFMVRREVVLPSPGPRRTAVTEVAVMLSVGALVALLLGILLDSSALVTTLGAVNSANAVRLVRHALAARRADANRPDPAALGPPPAPRVDTDDEGGTPALPRPADAPAGSVAGRQVR